MFITIYKKTKNNQLYLIRFELVGSMYRRWRGNEGRVLKANRWRIFNTNNYQTGKARASIAMFKEMNSFIEEGYSIYKKKSKKIKIVKPIIRIRKLNMKKIKKLFDEGHKMWYTSYFGKLIVRKTDGYLYDNLTHKRIRTSKWPAATKQELGYINNTLFTPFPWNIQGSPKELEMWLDYNQIMNLKTLTKINNTYYG